VTVRRRWSRTRRTGAALLVATVVVVAGATIDKWDLVVAVWSHRIGGPAETWEVVPFPEGSQPRLRVALIGDVGDGGEQAYETAAAIEAQSEVDRYDILMLLGDNVYPAGEPERVEATVFAPFEPLLDSGTELIAVLGNHDVLSDHGDAQLEALGMPARWYAVERGDLLGIALDSTRPDDPEQLAWLERTLASSDATWKVVGLHHPAYSSGFHGSDEQLRDTFVPLFERYGVQVVFSGHEHDYQRSVPIDGVTYIVSGAGSRTRRTGTSDFTAIAYATHHFVDLNVFDDHLVIRAIDEDGAQFDEVVVPTHPGTRG
jgi:3',5'-cyclic AMP phosphodiesterase CpdA